ncbi:MAG: tpiA [Gammaproteobacteria bacterium]|jgi:triosephosphate isomerase|nr:tpiA [Gammaproteobacteria bacterium]
MRKKIVAGNWKMHGSRVEAKALFNAIKEGARAYPSVSIIVFPSFVHLQSAENELVDSLITWGGQNLYLGESGAFTGEVSGLMLVDYGCQYVLVGHSERRLLFREDAILVAEKFKAALQFGLLPVLCVGETRQQREQDQTQAVIAEQLKTVLQMVGIDVFRQAIIAYEPVWAIGTGITATPVQAQAVHEFIRSLLAEYSGDVADVARILYGGSVKADNAAELFCMPDIDGGLVGNASLDAKSFLAICQAAT